MKKFLSLVLALVMTMSLVTVSAGAKDFTDDDKITYEEAVAVISEIGVVDGYKDGSFNPTNVLTRQAAAKIICNLILGPTTAAELHADTAPYKDVPLTSDFAGYIAYCQKEGIISGYADGTFRPGNTLTGYAFMKMLLGALGYDANSEQYTGANWSINVAKRALNIGLAKGLTETFNGIKAVNREEACLYAFNTLQADLVEYETIVSTTINGQQVNVGNSIAKAQRWNNSATKIENIKEDNYIQFAEQYFTKLKKVADTDDFMRPAHTWTYNKAELGTYVDKDKLVESYTTGVSGRDIYDLLKAATIRDNDLECWTDGGENTGITKEDLVRSNNEDLNDTGTGVLTEVYLDTDNDLITIVSVNTYLAQATSSYNEKKEGVALRVYDSAAGSSKTVDLVDVPAIKDVEKDEYYLVNMSKKETGKEEVVELTDVEILSDSTVTKFSKGGKNDNASKLTTGGTEYKNNVKAYYDSKVLNEYNETLLTDITYNVYLDPYGNFIGVDIYDGVKNYVFITGYDMGKSNLSIKTADAAAIFTDGTMKVIEVNVKDTNKNIGKSTDPYYANEWSYETAGCVTTGDNTDGNRQHNRWYTYTEDDGVYTLKPTKMFASDIAQINPAPNATEATINCSNVRLDATTTNDGMTHQGDDSRAYGEDASVFITVEAETVSTTPDGTENDAITKVNGVYTGVQDVDIEITAGDKKSIAHSVYTLMDSDNYIIASIILGDANGAVANYAYILSGAKSEARIDGTYYWEFKAILDGEIQTLTVKSKYSSTIDMLEQNHVQELRFDGDYVVAIEDVDAKDIYAFNEKRIEKQTVYDIGHSINPVLNKDTCKMTGDLCPVLHTTVNKTADSGTARSEITGRLTKEQNYIYLQGRTMYTGDADQGLTFVKDAKAVVLQMVNGEWEEEEYASVPEAVSVLADPVENTKALEFGGRIVAILNSQGVAEWVVIISDTEVETGAGTSKPSGSNTDAAPLNLKGFENNDNAIAGIIKTQEDGAYTINTAYSDMAGDPEDNIIFKFTTPTASCNASLTISDRRGNIMYNETATFADAGAHFFYVQVTGTIAGNAGFGSMKTTALESGTYTYVVNAGGEVVEGEFTVR